MQTYISILRGINVSGHNLIKMKALQALYENLGFSKVRTYIQSGNVVFESNSADAGTLEKIISDGIRETFSFEVPVIVLEREELKSISAHNSFINARGEEITKLHVTILSGSPVNDLAETIRHEDYLPDEFYILGRSVYIFCPGGYGNTKLSNAFFEKKLKVRATTRNWKTVLELVKMSE
jgi:uncharacterized protein (DUF1697 family)